MPYDLMEAAKAAAVAAEGLMLLRRGARVVGVRVACYGSLVMPSCSARNRAGAELACPGSARSAQARPCFKLVWSRTWIADVHADRLTSAVHE